MRQARQCLRDHALRSPGVCLTAAPGLYPCHMDTKRCNGCGEAKPLDTKHWYYRKSGRDAGKPASPCKACQQAKAKTRTRTRDPELDARAEHGRQVTAAGIAELRRMLGTGS